MRSNLVTAYAPAILKLLQGPLYSDDSAAWSLLLNHADEVRLHCAQMGLALHLDEEDGFAFLHQPPIEDDEGHVFELPRLTRRVQLSYHVTLLCVLLREQLLQFDASNIEGVNCILTKEQIRELVRPFLPERNNELAVQNRINEMINRVIELGFLKKATSLGPDYFEVRRILKAKMNAEQLVEIKERLKGYGASEQRTVGEA
jgi:hypothetical protein